MLRLRTFGGVSLERDDGVDAGARMQKRRLALLILLAAARDRSVSRDKIVAYFWPDADMERARHSLAQLLYGLRRDLNATAVISGAAEALRIDREVLSSDVGEFEDAMERGDDERAVALYGGPFLDGWFLADAPEYERWVEHERGTLRELAMRALKRLADAAVSRGDHDGAVRWWRQLVTLDPLAARASMGLMTALAASGDRAAALRHAQIYDALVRQEIDATPDAALMALAERIRTAPAPAPPSPARPSATDRDRSPEPDLAAPTAAHPRRRRRLTSIGGVLGVSILALWGLVRAAAPSRTAPAPDRRSVAVLPFLNLSAEPDNEYFSDGMTEELINELARVDGLRVTARTSAFAFKGKLAGVQEIGRQLHVATVLEGSVRRTGKRLRVTARLVDIASGYELWSDIYDRELTDVFQVQEDIAQSIAGRLRGDLAHRPSRPPPRAATNAEAYDLYLRGRYFWNERTYASLLKSIDFYQRALAIDSGYALAYAGLADSYAILGANGFVPLGDVQPKAEAAASRALALDASLSSVHATRALLRWLSWEWRDADREFQQSIALDSAYVPARLWYALYLSGVRRSDEAVRQITRAGELDPLSLIVNTERGHVLELARRDGEAENAYQRALEIDSTYWLANYLITLLHYRRGQFAQASNDLARLRPPHGTDLDPLRAYGYARRGDATTARRMLAVLEEPDHRRYVSPYAIAYIHATLGDRAEAMQWLEDAYARRASEMSLLAADPLLDPVHADPRYGQLLQRMKLE